MKKIILLFSAFYFSLAQGSTTIGLSSSAYVADKSVYIASSSYVADVSVYIASSFYIADAEICIGDDLSDEEAVAAFISLDL